MSYKKSYFQKHNTHRKNKIKVELDLSKYAKKSDLKGVTGIDTTKFTEMIDLASLKSDADDINFNKLKLFLLI